jgi:hypothetical protein
MIEDCVKDDFHDFLDVEQFYQTEERVGTYCHHKKYGKNVFHHHCPLHDPEHLAYFQRCVARFRLVFDARFADSVLFVRLATTKERDPEFPSSCKSLHEALKPCHFLSIECLEEQQRRSVVVDEMDEHYTRVTVSCTSKNTGVRFADALDNAAIASVLKWFDYDLIKNVNAMEKKVWPYCVWEEAVQKSLGCMTCFRSRA